MPFRSSLARSAGKLLGVFRERDLSLRGAVQSSRKITTSGGTIYPYGGKTIHAFTETGKLLLAESKPNVEYVMVGGGGAGGSNYSGGGGGGGYLTGTFPSLSGGLSYTVTIGPGGAKTAGSGIGGNGGDTVFNSITAYGGGGGGWFNGSTPGDCDGAAGGSGGGAGGSNYYQSVGGAGYNSPQPTRQGYPGAQGYAPQYYATGGSGGGAGAAAAAPFDNGGSGHDASPGGVGLQAPSTFRDASNPYGTPGPSGGGFYFAGGGGATITHGSSNQVTGGAGGGGGGNYPGGSAVAGTTNTGGGGGGGPAGGNGANGGSGILLIAY